MDEKTLGLISGNAAGIAAQLLQLSYTHDLNVEAILAQYQQVLPAVTDALVAAQAETLVKANLPGTTTVPATTAPAPAAPAAAAPAIVAPPAAPAAPAANVVPFPGAAAQVAAIPGVAQPAGDTEVDEAARQLLTDINNGQFEANWEDNRALKAQGGKYAKIPHVKHKTWTRPGSKYPVGVYLDDRKMSPDLKAALAQAFGL